MQDADTAKKIRDIMDRFDADIAELRRVHRERILAILKEIEEERLQKVREQLRA